MLFCIESCSNQLWGNIAINVNQQTIYSNSESSEQLFKQNNFLNRSIFETEQIIIWISKLTK